ncbi:MAG: hypothetical protein CMB61_06660 [Euryarchaeota archaeon]|nr:hypothetical protein [Euryarchaeota archaeon]|tara:strand:+ start:355 stop:1179 length:825 start_codon:yes stop_codon:yes gene_type:complete
MSVVGKIDAAAFSNTISVTNGDATVTKNAADSVVVGDVLSISSVNYIVKQVTSTTAIELHKVYAGSTATVAAASVIKRTPPKAVAEFVILGGDSNSYELIFVDTTEDGIASNKTRGISGPGWWQYRTYQTHNGDTRHKAECLVPLKVAAGTSGDDADDTVAADVLETITVGTQPANSTSSSGAGTFVAAFTVDQSGTKSFKWQRQTASATTRWVDVSASLDTGITYADFTTATLAYSGLAGTTLNGYKYRCVLNTSKGAAQKYTDGAATITFGS